MSNLRSRTTREPVPTSGAGGPSGSASPYPGSPLPGVPTNTGASLRQGTRTKERAPAAPETVRARAASSSSVKSKRLSATDISALASMKNVAKCDTWCELQNPVNHRVFERKLRPKPLGRGHACLGVTRRCSPAPPSGERRGADDGLPCVTPRGWHKCRVLGDERHDNRWLSNLGCPLCAFVAPERPATLPAPLRPSFQRDPRSGGVTR